jgi:hypothetical protein
LSHLTWIPTASTDSSKRRASGTALDIQAESNYDAAHLHLSVARSQAAAMLPNQVPIPTPATAFEVVLDGKVFTVKGAALRRWIAKRRAELKGP